MKIWARGERQGSLCPVCGKENLRWHVWWHLEQVNVGSNYVVDCRRCWCGKVVRSDEWEDHMVEQGGHRVHYLACALNIGG